MSGSLPWYVARSRGIHDRVNSWRKVPDTAPESAAKRAPSPGLERAGWGDGRRVARMVASDKRSRHGRVGRFAMGWLPARASDVSDGERLARAARQATERATRMVVHHQCMTCFRIEADFRRRSESDRGPEPRG